jgi:hypothetical protein
MINLRKEDPVADAVKEILQQEALKGNQHKIDKNKNNKIDAEDFKILRKEETVEEGLKDIAKKAFKTLTGGSDEDQRKDLQRKMGVPQTGKKPTQKEEVEQIDEVQDINDPLDPNRMDNRNRSVKRNIQARLGQDERGDARVRAGQERSTHMRNKPQLPEHNVNEGKEESQKDFDDRQKRLAAASAETAKDPKRLERLSKIPGYSAAMDLAKKTTKEEVQGKTLSQFRENAFDWKKKPEPQPNGGSGKKQGSAYGGSKQKDKPEQDTDEKK